MAAIATGEDAYQRSNQAVFRVNTLISEIDATPDIKASIELDTRFLAEISQQLNELFHVTSVNTANQDTLAVQSDRD